MAHQNIKVVYIAGAHQNIINWLYKDGIYSWCSCWWGWERTINIPSRDPHWLRANDQKPGQKLFLNTEKWFGTWSKTLRPEGIIYPTIQLTQRKCLEFSVVLDLPLKEIYNELFMWVASISPLVIWRFQLYHCPQYFIVYISTRPIVYTKPGPHNRCGRGQSVICIGGDRQQVFLSDKCAAPSQICCCLLYLTHT